MIAFAMMLTIISSAFVGVGYAPEALDGSRIIFPVHGNKQGYGPSPWWITDHEPFSFNQSSGGYNEYSPGPRTPHILWTYMKGPGGTVGGSNPMAHPSGIYFTSEFGDIGPAIGGRCYMRSGDDINCVDIETGEQLWWRVGLDQGQYVGRTGAVFLGELVWEQGGDVVRYELSSGEYIGSYTMKIDLNGIPFQGWTPETSSPAAVAGGSRINERYFIGSSRLVINDHQTRIGTNALVRLGAGNPIIWGETRSDFLCAVWGDYAIGQEESYEGVIYCLNRWTGDVLWTRPFESYHSGGAGYGMYYVCGYDNYVYAFNLANGDLAWRSEVQAQSYYTEQGMSIGEGKVAFCGYDGGMYVFDAFDGSFVGQTYVGDNFEYEHYASYYGTWPFQTPPIGASKNLFYSMTGDHTRPRLTVPGETILAMDGETGEEMWRFPGHCISHGSQMLVADGLLIAMDGQSGQVLAFGKGPTAVEVNVPEAKIAKGDYTWITGRITDQSTAQKGTPVVSKESMQVWMEYLHSSGREPAFGEITGVEASVIAVNTHGELVNIGVVETDSEGYFKILWTPPSEDLWTITVAFNGDESYWDSWGAVDLAVGPSVALITSSISSAAATFTAIAVVAVSSIYLMAKRRANYRREEIAK